MTAERFVIGLAIVLGLFIGVIDTILDSYVFYDAPLRELLFTRAPRHEIFVRTLILASYAVFGLVVSRMITQRKRAEKERSRLASVLEVTSDVVGMSDPDGRPIYLNKAARKLLGLPKEGIPNQSISELHPPQGKRTLWEEAIPAAIRDGHWSGENVLLAKDGLEIPISQVVLAHRGDAGEIEFLSTIAREISEAKEAEMALREREATLRSIFRAAPTGIGLLRDGVLVQVNDRICDMVGYEREELIGNRDSVLYASPQECQRVNRVVHARSGESDRATTETEWKKKDGSIVDVLLCSTPVDPDNVSAGITFTALDITGRKRVESQHRMLFETMLAGCAVHEMIFDDEGEPVDYRYLSVNPAFEQLTGLSAEEVVGNTVREILPDIEDHWIKTYGRVASTGEPCRFESFAAPLGRHYEVVAFRPRVGQFACVFQDISERKRGEERLRESERFARSTLNALSSHIAIVNQDGVVEAVNNAWRAFAAANPPVVGNVCEGSNYLDVCDSVTGPDSEVAAEFAQAIRDVLAGRRGEFHLEYTCHSPDDTRWFIGRVTRFPESKSPRAVIAHENTTERRRAEERLRRMEAQLTHVARLSTMGELVASIAHELNQPLYSILNFSKACRNALADENPPILDDVREWSEEIAASAQRAGTIVTRLRSFSRRTEAVRSPALIHEIIEESVDLVGSEARRHRVDVALDLGGRSAVADVDRVQIQQVLVNLLRNAYEAMSEQEVARRQVTVRTVTCHQDIHISVVDAGVGLPDPDELDIFDPFATTKADGLGMGLAISRTIAEAHGGTLTAASNPNGGATFHFTLPAHQKELADVK